MNIRSLIVPVVLAFASSAFALPADLKAEQDRLVANLKTELARFQKAAKQAEADMEAAKTQTASKKDDDALLAAWKAQNSAMEDMVNFATVHAVELKQDDPSADAKLAQLQTALAVQKKLAGLAETEGAVKVLGKFGENVRKGFEKAGGKVSLNAKANWTDTSIAVKTGQVVHLEVTGKWTVSPRYELFDADGLNVRPGFLDYRVYRGANLGAAICRVGTSDKIYGGKSQRFMADQDGDLQCRINDSGLGNNVGEVEVELVRDDAP